MRFSLPKGVTLFVNTAFFTKLILKTKTDNKSINHDVNFDQIKSPDFLNLNNNNTNPTVYLTVFKM